jgi:hypothetical protein
MELQVRVDGNVNVITLALCPSDEDPLPVVPTRGSGPPPEVMEVGPGAKVLVLRVVDICHIRIPNMGLGLA